MKFDKLVKKIVNEVSQPFEGGYDAYTTRGMSGSQGGGYGNFSSVQRSDRNFGLEKEDRAEKMYWTVYRLEQNSEGKLVRGQPLKGKDGRAFGAMGASKAQAMVAKLEAQPFNQGKKFGLYNNDGVSLGAFLR